MADDTRQSPEQGSSPPTSETPAYNRPKPKHDFPKSQAGKLWDALGNPNSPANEAPGGMVNTAGGRPREVTWQDAFRFSQFTKDGPKFYQTPCARDSLLVGICSGGAAGGLHFILKGLSRLIITTNIAVATFTLTAGGMHYWCTQRQREEAKGMAAAVVGMRMLHEKKAKEKAVVEAAAAAEKRKAEEDRMTNKRWYKLW